MKPPPSAVWAFFQVLASGATIPISQLHVGDKVLATSAKTGKTQAETVTAVLVHHDTDLYDLKIQDHGKTSVIDTTSNHLFWVPYLKQWVPAAKLRKGEPLKTPSGQRAIAWGGKVPANRDGWMWDLTIQDDHDFYVRVGGAYVLAHNCAAPKKMPFNMRIRRGIEDYAKPRHR